MALIILGILFFAVFIILYSAKGMSFNEMGTGNTFNLPGYLAASKKFKKYQTGWREEYKLGTEDDLCSAGAFRMRVSKKNEFHYFSTKDIRYMQKNTWM